MGCSSHLSQSLCSCTRSKLPPSIDNPLHHQRELSYPMVLLYHSHTHKRTTCTVTLTTHTLSHSPCALSHSPHTHTVTLTTHTHTVILSTHTHCHTHHTHTLSHLPHTHTLSHLPHTHTVTLATQTPYAHTHTHTTHTHNTHNTHTQHTQHTHTSPQVTPHSVKYRIPVYCNLQHCREWTIYVRTVKDTLPLLNPWSR